MARNRTAAVIDSLLAHGRSAVTTPEAAELLGVPPEQVRVRLRPLLQDGHVFSPARGLWVAIPPQYRTWHVVPGIDFIDQMLGHLGRDYYIGWLSAAELYGAAHQRPQVLQVAVDRHLADRDIERVKLRFTERRHAADMPRVRRNVPTGQVWVSTPEVTALDLAAEPALGAGLNNVATVLIELGEEEQIEPHLLAQAAERYSLAAVRRLGHLLERTGNAEAAAALHPVAEPRRSFPADLLSPTGSHSGPVDARWRLRINTDVDPDL